jgi:peptide/nickel transport system ATP-binding protein
MTEPKILEVANLTVEFPTDDGVVRAVRGVSWTLGTGETLGIVGESGAGKSVTSLAVMGLLPAAARVSGSIRFAGRELLGLSEEALSGIRGQGISMIFQDPMTSLNPVYTAGHQIIETLRAHRHGMSRQAARERAVELLDIVGIPSPAQRVDSYPHELSGGMRQRAALARALAQDARVLLMDEPFGALDAITRDLLHDELERVWQETGLTVLFVTHNVREAVRLGNRVLVLSSRPGRVVDEFPVDIPRPRRLDDTEVSSLSATITDRLRQEVRRHGA